MADRGTFRLCDTYLANLGSHHGQQYPGREVQPAHRFRLQSIP